MLEWSWEFCTPNVLLSTFGAFLMFTCIKGPVCELVEPPVPEPVEGPVEPVEGPVISKLARLTYGMYLMHMFFLAPIAGWIVAGDPANPIIPVALAIPTIALLSFACSALTTWLLSFLPGSKYLVGTE